MANASRQKYPLHDPYARPNQDWTCAKSGCECPLGPSRRGQCQASAECKPVERQNAWYCTRAIAQGGVCEAGPLPDGTCCHPIEKCSPQKSIRRIRMELSAYAFAISLAVGLLLVAVPLDRSPVQPGILARMHATSPNGCADCHDVSNQSTLASLAQWGSAPAGHVQSEKCLACHQDLGPSALNPHSIDTQMLDELVLKASERPAPTHTSHLVSLSKTVFGTRESTSPIDCAVCHKEHHGENADLKRLSNEQCQTCHTGAFHSLGFGHPEFDSYPATGRTRIFFDHTSHYGRHFAAQKDLPTQVDCLQCHVEENSGSMSIRNFEASCGSCHDSQIKDDFVPGIAVLSVPVFDTETLRTANLDIGSWPQLHPNHVSATTQLRGLSQLILRDSLHSAAAERIKHLNLADLSGASPEELEAVRDFAWQFKQGLYDLCFAEMPAEKLGLSQRQLCDHLPSAVLNDLCQSWFPLLATEVEAYAGGERSAATDRADTGEPDGSSYATEQADQPAKVMRRGFYLEESALTLRYRPIGHADPVMQAIWTVLTGPGIAKEFSSHLSSFAPGRCTKCHTVDQHDAAAHVNWQGFRADALRKRFTRFDHTPHINMPQSAQCVACHDLRILSEETAADLKASFHHSGGLPATDQTHFVHQFAGIVKQTCSNCHRPGSAGDGCLACHSYHVHAPGSWSISESRE